MGVRASIIGNRELAEMTVSVVAQRGLSSCGKNIGRIEYAISVLPPSSLQNRGLV